MVKIVKRSAPSTSDVKAAKKAKRADDARKVAAATDGSLNTDQIRVLRILSSGRPTLMREIKAGLGMLPTEKYSSKFLNGIHALVKGKMISCDTVQDSRAFAYAILAKGKTALKEAVAEAKVIERAKAKE